MSQTPRARLAALYDPVALCFKLQQALQRAPCDHTFTHLPAVLPARVDGAAVLALVQELGAHCDCEVVNNLCPRVI